MRYAATSTAADKGSTPSAATTDQAIRSEPLVRAIDRCARRRGGAARPPARTGPARAAAARRRARRTSAMSSRACSDSRPTSAAASSGSSAIRSRAVSSRIASVGEGRPETVVEVATDPAPLLLAGGDQVLAGPLEVAVDRDRLDQRHRPGCRRPREAGGRRGRRGPAGSTSSSSRPTGVAADRQVDGRPGCRAAPRSTSRSPRWWGWRRRRSRRTRGGAVGPAAPASPAAPPSGPVLGSRRLRSDTTRWGKSRSPYTARRRMRCRATASGRRIRATRPPASIEPKEMSEARSTATTTADEDRGDQGQPPVPAPARAGRWARSRRAGSAGSRRTTQPSTAVATSRVSSGQGRSGSVGEPLREVAQQHARRQSAAHGEQHEAGGEAVLAVDRAHVEDAGHPERRRVRWRAARGPTTVSSAWSRAASGWSGPAIVDRPDGPDGVAGERDEVGRAQRPRDVAAPAPASRSA